MLFKIWAGFLLTLCLLASAGCAEQKLVVGCDNYPPFISINENGEFTGLDVELAQEAFGRMGYQPVFEIIDWEKKKNLVESGEIDCIWGSFSIDGREEEYRWAGPYMVSRQVVAVLPQSKIETLADLEGKIVAVQSTTKPESIFLNREDERIPEIRWLYSLENRELIYTALGKGYADAIAAHESAIRQYMEDYGVEFRILEEPLLTAGLGVAFAKGDERGIDERLTRVFADMLADGTTRRIAEKYLKEPEHFLEVDSLE